MVQPHPKVSVLVPVYNTGKFLRRCLDSICSQTFQEMEVILVDDGSTDDSAEICAEYARKDPRMKIISQGNGGLASARNVGMRHARGDYFCFVDSDDWIEPQLIGPNYALASQSGADILIFGYVQETARSLGICRRQRLPPLVKIETEAQRKELLPLIFESGNGFAVWQQLIKSEFIKKNNLFFPPLSRAMDMFFLFELYSKKSKIVTNPIVSYHYCSFASQSKVAADITEQHVLCFQKFLEIFPGWTDHPRNYRLAASLFSLWFCHVVPNMIVSDRNLGYRDRIKGLQALFRNFEIDGWIKKFKLSCSANIVVAIMLLILKLKSPVLLYWFTLFKKYVRDNTLMDYGGWFYAKNKKTSAAGRL